MKKCYSHKSLDELDGKPTSEKLSKGFSAFGFEQLDEEFFPAGVNFSTVVEKGNVCENASDLINFSSRRNLVNEAELRFLMGKSQLENHWFSCQLPSRKTVTSLQATNRLKNGKWETKKDMDMSFHCFESLLLITFHPGNVSTKEYKLKIEKPAKRNWKKDYFQTGNSEHLYFLFALRTFLNCSPLRG